MKTKAKEIKLKETTSEPIEKEVEGIMNTIKGKQIKNGNIPNTPPVVIVDFAGKKLRITKNLVFKGKKYQLEKDTPWEKVDVFFRKWMSFSKKDFE